MYPLFLVICTALVVLSPIGLDAWLNFHEYRVRLRRLRRLQTAESPGTAWALHRSL